VNDAGFPAMQILIFLLLALLLYWLARAHWSGGGRVSAEERAVTIRLGVVAWFLGFVFVAAFVFLPNKPRVLMLVPVAVFALGFTKFWRDKQARLRREQAERARVETMKRVN
jgi:hypothetical protein